MKEIITDEFQLSDRAEEIDVRKEGKLVQEIVRELKVVVRDKGLKGLSAPQIGYNRRIIVINFNGDIRSFVNPIYTNVSGIGLAKETCSSIPGKTFIRIRNTSVDVTYSTPLGKIETRKLFGLAAIVAQHEIDHLEGLLLSDVGLEVDEDYDNATDEEKEKIIEMYLDSLDLRRKEVHEVIDSDKDLSQTMKAIEFMQEVETGETKLADKDYIFPKTDKENSNEVWI